MPGLGVPRLCLATCYRFRAWPAVVCQTWQDARNKETKRSRVAHVLGSKLARNSVVRSTAANSGCQASRAPTRPNTASELLCFLWRGVCFGFSALLQQNGALVANPTSNMQVVNSEALECWSPGRCTSHSST